MNVSERLAIEQACSQILIRYASSFDARRADDVVALFADDAQWQRPGTQRLTGLDAIRTFVAGAMRGPLTRHILTNMQIDVVDEDRATGLCYFTLYAASANDAATPAKLNGPAIIGEYRDEFVRRSAGWRILSRNTTYAFKA